MGHVSVGFVPSAQTYEEAKAIHDRTTPIRGHSPERRPLGRRRDHHTYWVRMDRDVVEFVCYRTPVVKFYPDGLIEVRSGGYSSNTTHGFIEQVLRIKCGGYMQHSKLTVGGQIRMFSGNDVVRLVPKPEGGLMLESVPERRGYAMSRKAANTVRRRYEEFADYFAAFINLRSEEKTRAFNRYDPYGRRHSQNIEHYKVVTFSTVELADAIGLNESTRTTRHGYANRVGYELAMKLDIATEAQRPWAKDFVRDRRAQHEQLLALITSDQPEEMKHDSFYKAALLLCLITRNPTILFDVTEAGRTVVDDTITAHPDIVLKHYDEALMMAHAKEVLEVTVLEGEKMPNRRYEGWVTE